MALRNFYFEMEGDFGLHRGLRTAACMMVCGGLAAEAASVSGEVASAVVLNPSDGSRGGGGSMYDFSTMSVMTAGIKTRSF